MKKDRLAIGFLCFIVFGMIGWFYEVAVMYFEMHLGFVNRGFLYGPCLPIYGMGGILILLLFGRLKGKKLAIGPFNLTPVLCFLAICLLATGLELAASYALERWMGKFLWDYRGAGFGPTFQGRIALLSSLRFGVIGMVVLYGIYPPLKKVFSWSAKNHPKLFWAGSMLVFCTFCADVIYHLIHGSHAQW